MTKACIAALNPNLLTGFGAEGQPLWNAVFWAACIASAVGMFTMAFLANKLIALTCAISALFPVKFFLAA